MDAWMMPRALPHTVRLMSALPPKADIRGAKRYVHFELIAEIGRASAANKRRAVQAFSFSRGNFTTVRVYRRLRTISARERSEAGIFILLESRCAVLRLMTNSNLSGNETGRSAGEAPRKMCPTYAPTFS